MAFFAEPRNDKNPEIDEKRPGVGPFWESGDPVLEVFLVFSNFSHYKKRFTMPGESEGMYFSYNMGPVHFIAISTEFYYFVDYGVKQILNQYKWLEKDLKVHKYTIMELENTAS